MAETDKVSRSTKRSRLRKVGVRKWFFGSVWHAGTVVEDFSEPLPLGYKHFDSADFLQKAFATDRSGTQSARAT